MADNVMN